MDYRLPLFGVVAVFALGTLFMPERFMSVSGSAYALDGDTLAFQNDRVRIVGIDAPDAPEGPKEASGRVLQGLVNDNGPITCTKPKFDACHSPARSYSRHNLDCHFATGDSVGLTMIAAGYAVDYRSYSGGRYQAAMKQAAKAHRGLWGSDWDRMVALAKQRSRLEESC
tara:strand:+ start:43 stop:549 length:507 start_codon:yes stop_codon:yes gene_type:complete